MLINRERTNTHSWDARSIPDPWFSDPRAMTADGDGCLPAGEVRRRRREPDQKGTPSSVPVTVADVNAWSMKARKSGAKMRGSNRSGVKRTTGIWKRVSSST